MATASDTNRMLDKIISTIGDLPATPAIIATLMNLTSDINTEIDKITKAIMADQSLTAKVLKMSNSSFYGRAREVKTLREAIVILGFMTLHSLVIATSTQTLYQKTIDHGISDKLWEHGFASAIAARLIAKATRFSYVEEAFIAGLLHDIGKLLMTQKLPDEYRRIANNVESSRGSFAELEEAEFGFNHAQLGALLLQKWSFPEELINAVGQHHQPGSTDGEEERLPCIINLANFMAKKLDIGFNDYSVENLSELASAAVLNLDASQLDAIHLKLQEHFENERELFRLSH